MNSIFGGVLGLLLYCFGGCTQDYSLAPPASSGQVTVRGKFKVT